jgi:hypothetical protein
VGPFQVDDATVSAGAGREAPLPTPVHATPRQIPTRPPASRLAGNRLEVINGAKTGSRGSELLMLLADSRYFLKSGLL